jgi:exodeoxyribonuclease V alpha subunit
MVDLPLMARLLAALPPSARLVLLGDRDQLASVEAGNVLGDITGRGQPIRYGAAELNLLSAVGAFSSEQRDAIACELGGPEDDDVRESPGSGPPSPATAVALLRHSWRFGADSGIGALARAVNLGDGERALQLLDDGEHRDISRLAPTPSGLNPACVSWAVERFSAIAAASGPEDALRVLERARVLCALHRGPFGVEALNAGISTALLASGRLPRFSGDDGTRDGIGAGNHVGLHHAMPLMVTANDYEVGLFNGDVGLLWQDAAGRPRAHFHGADGALRTLTLRQLPPYRCAYALTVHKSQGSEFDDVLLVLPPEPHPLATRELLYTAVTRARRQVLVHAGEALIRQASQARVRRASKERVRNKVNTVGWTSAAPSTRARTDAGGRRSACPPYPGNVPLVSASFLWGM